jgi:glycosyltransferase involved in cell wall biosynthesis
MVDATGGTERVALEIARIQARRGAKVTVASIMPDAWHGSWEGVNLRHLKPHSWAKIGNWDYRTQLSLAEFVRTERFDLVHLHEHRWTRFLGKRPKVMQFHNNPFDEMGDEAIAAAAPQYWRELSTAGAQIAVSAFVRQRLLMLHERAGTAAAANVIVNPSGVHADILSPEQLLQERARIRSELGLKDSDVLFLFAGAVRPEKGVVQLAQAFVKLAAEHDNASLVIAGGSKLWVGSQPANHTAELQVRSILSGAVAQRRASMLGIISPAALPSYYAAADIFVLPSMFQETFGLVILEAFAAGVPVIGARSGGIPELVKDGHTGLLVDQGDVDGLYRAMQRLLLDHALRKRLGAAARETAVDMSWESTVDRLERIYESIAAPEQSSVASLAGVSR